MFPSVRIFPGEIERFRRWLDAHPSRSEINPDVEVCEYVRKKLVNGSLYPLSPDPIRQANQRSLAHADFRRMAHPNLLSFFKDFVDKGANDQDIGRVYLDLAPSERVALNFWGPIPKDFGPPAPEVGGWASTYDWFLREVSVSSVEVWSAMGSTCKSWRQARCTYVTLFESAAFIGVSASRSSNYEEYQPQFELRGRYVFAPVPPSRPDVPASVGVHFNVGALTLLAVRYADYFVKRYSEGHPRIECSLVSCPAGWDDVRVPGPLSLEEAVRRGDPRRIRDEIKSLFRGLDVRPIFNEGPERFIPGGLNRTLGILTPLSHTELILGDPRLNFDSSWKPQDASLLRSPPKSSTLVGEYLWATPWLPSEVATASPAAGDWSSSLFREPLMLTPAHVYLEIRLPEEKPLVDIDHLPPGYLKAINASNVLWVCIVDSLDRKLHFLRDGKSWVRERTI